MKETVAKILYYTGISSLCFHLSRKLYGRHIRVVNYHGTPHSMKSKFREQLEWYARWYTDTSLSSLRTFLRDSGTEERGRPGIIISFDDGKRNNFDVAKPLLEEKGFTGWFFLPVAWVLGDLQSQREWQREDATLLEEYPEGRVIVSVDEVRQLMGKHVIGCHTFSHYRMKKGDESSILEKEIVKSLAELERVTGVDYRIFCWVGGEEVHYTKPAAERIAEAGYEFSFTTNTFPILKGADPLRLERSNIECHYSKELLLFQLSGLMDLFYSLKRKRLDGVFRNPARKKP